jgi:hypothetical protein
MLEYGLENIKAHPLAAPEAPGNFIVLKGNDQPEHGTEFKHEDEQHGEEDEDVELPFMGKMIDQRFTAKRTFHAIPHHITVKALFKIRKQSVLIDVVIYDFSHNSLYNNELAYGVIRGEGKGKPILTGYQKKEGLKKYQNLPGVSKLIGRFTPFFRPRRQYGIPWGLGPHIS